MYDENHWLEWARELQFLSQSALAYCKDVYDIERFRRIRQISAEMVSRISQTPLETVKDLFSSDEGYQTPKLDTRSAVIRDDRILLVKERDGHWALPGGWVDYNLTVAENAVKETLEESGMTVRPLRVIALQEHNRHNTPPSIHNICSVYLLCEYVSGAFAPNAETVDCGFFARDDIPAPLAVNKNTPAQIDMCFRAAADPNWQVPFD